MVKKTIVTCSGGLDSVGLLWKLLHETDDEILVQHIRIKCFWKHWEAEEASFLNCMEYIKSHSRPFTVLPTMEYESRGIAPYRPLGAFCGTAAALQYGADRVVRATVKIDIESINRNDTWVNLDDVMLKIIDILSKDTNIIFERPVKDLDKRDWFTIMPEELTNMVIPCWHPTLLDGKWIGCGRCHSCLRHAEGKARTPPTHGDEWEREVVQYKRPVPIKRLYGTPTVLHFLDSSQENIEHLWHLLTETDMNVIVQPIEINRSIPDMTKIMEYLKNNTRDFILMPTTRFILPFVFDGRIGELAKIFCAGNLTRVYRTYISDIAFTFPTNSSLKDECKEMFNVYYFGKELIVNDTIGNTGNLPDQLKRIINA